MRGKIKPESVEFPIFDNPKTFKAENRVKKLPEKHRRAIESVQSYDGRNPGLWLLHELAREYRHRVVHPTGLLPSPESYRVEVNGQIIRPVDPEIIPHDRLEHGNVVMRFGLPDGVGPDPDVHPKIATYVGIDHVLCRTLIGTSVLNQITSGTAAALRGMGELFLP